MSYCRRLQIAMHVYRSHSSKFITLPNLSSRTISTSTAQNHTKWFQNKRIRKIVISCGVLGSLVYASYDTVPYTNRSCRVFFPRMVDKLLGDLEFTVLVNCPEVPIPIIETHPEIHRLRSILSHIVEAGKVTDKHIGYWSWDVFVVDGKEEDDDDDDGLKLAYALPNGKIFISKQFLEDFTTDAEIATVIGHEVAHVVARHTAERLALWLVSWIPLKVICLCITDPRVLELEKMEDFLYYYRRQREFEADYIGMMLMASAGYDPKSAPKVYLKMRRLYGDPWDFDWLIGNFPHSHPPEKQRAKRLFQVMEEASTLYMTCPEKKVSSQSHLWRFREIVTQFREPERIFSFMVFIYTEIAEYFRK